jgi:hypothetical protein
MAGTVRSDLMDRAKTTQGEQFVLEFETPDNPELYASPFDSRMTIEAGASLSDLTIRGVQGHKLVRGTHSEAGAEFDVYSDQTSAYDVIFRFVRSSGGEITGDFEVLDDKGGSHDWHLGTQVAGDLIKFTTDTAAIGQYLFEADTIDGPLTVTGQILSLLDVTYTADRSSLVWETPEDPDAYKYAVGEVTIDYPGEETTRVEVNNVKGYKHLDLTIEGTTEANFKSIQEEPFFLTAEMSRGPSQTRFFMNDWEMLPEGTVVASSSFRTKPKNHVFIVPVWRPALPVLGESSLEHLRSRIRPMVNF